jgi:DNA-binding GntR family transcriptional regulator
VSQAPVREALRDLERFGFVVGSPFRGTQVRRMSTHDLIEAYPIRAAIERIAARAAATRIDEPTLAHLDALIAAMRDAARRGDQNAHVGADFAFHHTIVKASGNRMLEQIWQTLRLATTTGVTHAMSQMTRRSLEEIGERHAPVLAALRARDPDRAEAEMRAHIEEPGEWIAQACEQERAANQNKAAG